MNAILKAILLLGAAVLGSSLVKAQEKITLKQALDSLLKNNIQLKQAALNETLAEENLAQSRYALYPNLNAAPGMYLNSGRSVDPITNQYTDENLFALNGSINSQAVLFQGFQKLNQVKQNKALLDADKSNFVKLKNELTLNLLAVYIAILNYQDLANAWKQQLGLAKFTEGQVQKSFDSGFKTQTDLSLAKAQSALADYNLTIATTQLDLSLLSLKQLMKVNPKKEIIVEAPSPDKLITIAGQTNAEQLATDALKINPDVQKNESLSTADSIGVNIAKGNYYPKVVLFGNIGSGYSSELQTLNGYAAARTDTIGFLSGSRQPVLGAVTNPIYQRDPFLRQFKDNLYFSAGIYLQIPIFNGFQARSAVKKAEIAYQEQLLSVQSAKADLNEIIYKAVFELKEANKKLLSAQASYNASKDAFDRLQHRYNIGFASQQEYNTAMTDLARSQSEVIRAQYELVFKSKIIDFYQGTEISL